MCGVRNRTFTRGTEQDQCPGTRNVNTSTKEANAGDDGRTVDEAVPAGRTSTILTIRPQPLPQAQPDPGMLKLLTSSENHVRVLEAQAAAVRKPAALHTPAEPTTTQVCWGKITTKKHKTWEGDGTLTIVGGKSVTLGDEEGKEVELVERIDGEVAKENDVPVKRVRFEARGGFRPPAESMCAGSPIVVSTRVSSSGSITKGCVPYCVAKHLRPHQREGVSFLYECVLGMKREDSEQFGAILADEMGLGKTLQMLALIYTLKNQGPYGQPIVKRVLIVTPSSLVDNRDREITKWLKQERIFTFIFRIEVLLEDKGLLQCVQAPWDLAGLAELESDMAKEKQRKRALRVERVVRDRSCRNLLVNRIAEDQLDHGSSASGSRGSSS
ncbi:conserved hypothetical protein [Culex quinquefasciatus]|uniref:SNF2 N-terminal domain-containing protein n=1 Tax=Culex quinquefasciatus TaxID=7176 RepID=B0WSK7_CULQU|nr:conserved hypothetical protein [Culex quinquefasciatus]|eukprot:XP_001852911.1 conserved hypothetical protein [Culex quinquefasciatus]